MKYRRTDYALNGGQNASRLKSIGTKERNENGKGTVPRLTGHDVTLLRSDQNIINRILEPFRANALFSLLRRWRDDAVRSRSRSRRGEGPTWRGRRSARRHARCALRRWGEAGRANARAAGLSAWRSIFYRGDIITIFGGGGGRRRGSVVNRCAVANKHAAADIRRRLSRPSGAPSTDAYLCVRTRFMQISATRRVGRAGGAERSVRRITRHRRRRSLVIWRPRRAAAAKSESYPSVCFLFICFHHSGGRSPRRDLKRSIQPKYVYRLLYRDKIGATRLTIILNKISCSIDNIMPRR